MQLACSGPSTCVARGARVATPKGPRPIEELEVGDEVLAVDPATGSPAATRITHVRSAPRGGGAFTVGAPTPPVTTDHPLFDPKARDFFPAGDWLLGTRSTLWALDGESCREVEVTARQTYAGVHTVFDLTVESELHTFVAEGFVVHNKVPDYCLVPDGGALTVSTPAEMRPECTCLDGTQSRWACLNGGGAPAVCEGCTVPDASVEDDGGMSDGGMSDGGMSDAGSGDGGSRDGG